MTIRTGLWFNYRMCPQTFVSEYPFTVSGLLGKLVEPSGGRAPLEEVSVGRVLFNSTTSLLVYYVFPDI